MGWPLEASTVRNGFTVSTRRGCRYLDWITDESLPLPLPVVSGKVYYFPRGFIPLIVCLIFHASQDNETGARFSSGEAPEPGWVRMFSGVVELIHALTPRSTKKNGRNRRVSNGSRDPAEGEERSNGTVTAGWTDTSFAELANPLFDAIPVLQMACDGHEERMGFTSRSAASDASAEYALWLTMDVLASVLRRQFGRGGQEVREGHLRNEKAAKDASNLLRCIRENPSPQTR